MAPRANPTAPGGPELRSPLASQVGELTCGEKADLAASSRLLVGPEDASVGWV